MKTGATISKELIRRIFANAYEWVLEDFGDHVLEAFSGIRLIGEIERPEGRETYEELKVCFGQFVNGSEAALADVLDYGNKQTRAACGLYFVWTGIFAYGEESGHELWPPVLEGLGIPHDPVLSNKCGRRFMECLNENQLERFAELESGRRYVDRVLLHGLIPDKHIKCFIDEVIDPELQSSMGLYETGDSVVRQLCQKNLTLLPKPIQHFIEHGHPVNADVIGRFLHMAREWEDDEPDQWQLWGLPKYMVDAFRKFGETTPEIGIRKSKKALASARPFLWFDLGTDGLPVLIIPPQSTPTSPQFVLRYDPINGQNGVEESWAPRNTPIKGRHQTDYLERQVGPARNGWTIAVSSSDSSQYRFAVLYEFPVTHQGDELPLFFFNARSGKLFNARSRGDNFPEELIVVYPVGASLDLVGGQTSTEPQALYGEWGDWQYMVCSLDVEGVFEYHGPNVTFDSMPTGFVDFRRTSNQDAPTLSGHHPPSWFCCLEPLPIFTAAKPIQIRCRGDLYHLWQRGIARLTRLDVLERPKRFALAFQQEGESWTASLPHPLEPGVYELHLQGALGVERIDHSFVYFPVTRFNAVMDPADEESLVRFFNIEAESSVDLEAHHKTQLENRENGVIVSPEADGAGARAFCAVRAFAASRFPVTVLLARRDIRWCRRRESGLIAWEEWLAQPEALPIQRVDELQDARVAVQIGYEGPADNLRRPLRLLLKGKADGVEEERDLMFLNASVLRRETHQTWVFDLKQFSDQLKNLREYHTADITIDLGRDQGAERLLLSLSRFPEYKDFRLTRLTSTKQTEQYQVAWTPQSNDPTTHRVLSCRPETGTDAPVSLPLEDRKAPPFVVELPAPRQPATWTAWVSIQSSRFAQGQSEAPAESQFRWFRTPEGWQDWLAWPDISPKDLDEKIGSIEALSQDVLCSAFPWMYFLVCLHRKRDQKALHYLQATVGHELLSKILSIRLDSEVETSQSFDFLYQHPQLPILNKIPGKDEVILNFSMTNLQYSQSRQNNIRLTIGDRISSQTRKELELLRRNLEETKARGYNLIEDWRKWLSTPGLDPFFSRIMSGHLNVGSTKTLSGVAALIIRLRAHGYEHAYVRKLDHMLNDLLKNTLEFIRSFLPRTFLQDLILHEVIVSCYGKKNVYSTKGSKKDIKTRYRKFVERKAEERDAEKGNAEAQFNLAMRYATGRDVPRDKSLAVYWLRKAAGQGLVQAQSQLQLWEN